MDSVIEKALSITTATVFILLTHANTVVAAPIYHPSGSQLTFGGMTHRQSSVSDMGNPAHASIDPTPETSGSRYGAGFSLGIGIEYDAHDSLWELVDRAANRDALAPGGGGDNDGDGDDSAIVDDEGGKSGPSINDITNPDIAALLDNVKANALELKSLLGTAIDSINAKLFISADIPILISNDALGGSWTFNANTSLTTNLKGLHDPIDIDTDILLQELEKAYDASQLKTGSATEDETFELSGGLFVTVEADGSTHFVFSNNSGTITRAAQISEISIGYSRKVWSEKENNVYLGIRPKYYSVGLSNKFIFLDNIDDAEDVFDALDKSNFHYTEKLSMDAGAIWTGKQYQLGATLTNINEPSFDYPDIDLSRIDSKAVVNAIRKRQTYTAERQLKLEGGYVSKSGAWGLNAGIDVNAVPDPMFDDYQWVSVGAGFASNNWWLPGARVGIRRNMAGTELTYLTGGITVFNIINMDIATTNQTIKVDGHEIPQGFILNIGAQVLF